MSIRKKLEVSFSRFIIQHSNIIYYISHSTGNIYYIMHLRYMLSMSSGALSRPPNLRISMDVSEMI